MKPLLGLQLWHLFKYAELTEVIKQNDKLFIDLPNKVKVGNIDGNVGKLLKSRFIHQFDENCPKDTLRMYAENEPAMKRNEDVLKDLPYTLEASDKIPDNSCYSEPKANKRRRFTKLLKLKIDTKLMLTVNIEIHVRLIYSQTVKIRHIDFTQGCVRKINICKVF